LDLYGSLVRRPDRSPGPSFTLFTGVRGRDVLRSWPPLALLIATLLLLLLPAIALRGDAERSIAGPENADDPRGSHPGAGERAKLPNDPQDAKPPHSVIVRYSKGADEEEVSSAIEERVEGARSEEVLETADAEIFAVKGPLNDAVRTAEALAGVKYAEESQRGSLLFSPDDRIYKRGKQWGPEKVNAKKAWEISRGDIDPGPDIGILDSGYFRHPDLKDKVVSEYDCGSNDDRADPVADPAGVHGTHIAGIAAAAADNRRGITGIAPGADLFIGQVFTEDGYFLVENLVQCGDVAMKRGVKVISISLAFKWKSRLLQEAVDRWNDHGINVVAAAGNDALPHGSRGHPLYPAASDGVIGVAATTEANTRLPSSSVGHWVDVAAPGEQIVSTSFERGHPTYESISGTSQATPHVAAALACARANGKGRFEAQRDLFERAYDRGQPGRDRYFGHGALNMLGTVRR
jgi:thermitase